MIFKETKLQIISAFCISLIIGVSLFVLLNIYNIKTPTEIANQKTEATSSSIKYTTYHPDLLGKYPKTVLLFKTNWCGSCKGLEQNIEENLARIPDNLQILTVDFDNQHALKLKYQVRVQHTLVQIDQNGEQIKTWVSSPTLQDLVKEII